MAQGQTFLPNSRNSVSVKVPASSPSSVKQRRLNATTTSHPVKSRSTRGIDQERTEHPRRGMIRNLPESIAKVIDSPRENAWTVALKVSGQLCPASIASTEIEGFGFELHHFPTTLQNLSSDELMFVCHLYNWGLNRAKQLAAGFRYKFQRPLPELLAALCELDRNCSGQNAKHKPLSNSSASSKKR